MTSAEVPIQKYKLKTQSYSSKYAIQLSDTTLVTVIIWQQK